MRTWSSSESYAIGDRRHVASVHRVYEAAKNMTAGSGAKDPTVPANQYDAAGNISYWIDAGPTNKFAMLGGLRAAAQVVSYEIPRVFAVVPLIMWAGTLSLSGIMSAQSGSLWGWFPRWFIFYPVIGQISFAIYLITTIAETNRIPFDLPEAESELVAGFHTEYGGMKFAFFFMAESIHKYS